MDIWNHEESQQDLEGSRDTHTHTHIIQLRRDVNMMSDHLFQTYDFKYKMLVMKRAEKITTFFSYFAVVSIIWGRYNKLP